MTPWIRTGDIVGHKPDFEIKCRHDGSRMFMRFSEVFTHRNLTFAIKEAVNVFEYKCPRCHLTQRFFVEDDPEYICKILDIREGVKLFVPPADEWAKEHEEIKKRLETLGYV